MKKRVVAYVASACAALALIGGGGFYYLNRSDPTVQLLPEDVTTVAARDIVSEVSAPGTIAGQRDVALTTSLTGPVATLDAEVGDRIDTDKVLVTIDTSQTQRELDAQRAAQAIEQQNARNQVETAQMELNNLQDTLNQGLNPEINSAEAAVNSAQSDYDAAEKAAAEAASRADSQEIAAARAGVSDARAAVRAADENSLQAYFTTLGETADGQSEPTTLASNMVSWSEADAQVEDARRKLGEAEANLDRTLKAHDQQAAKLQQDANAAEAQLRNAEKSLQAARLVAQHQIETQSQTVDQTLRSAASTNVSGELANETLELEIADSTVRSPIAGTITAVNASVGQPAEGGLITVTDDSTLLVKAQVKEADISKVTVGNRVQFTSPSAPGTTFNGQVSKISPAAVNTPTDSEGGGGGDTAANPKPEFGVEIRVDGNRDGLRLGSSTRTKIITSEEKDVLTVPLTAIINEDGKDYVYIVDNDTLEKREVTVGTRSVLDAAIDSGVDEGDVVVNRADQYTASIGQPVEVADA